MFVAGDTVISGFKLRNTKDDSNNECDIEALPPGVDSYVNFRLSDLETQTP